MSLAIQMDLKIEICMFIAIVLSACKRFYCPLKVIFPQNRETYRPGTIFSCLCDSVKLACKRLNEK